MNKKTPRDQLVISGDEKKRMISEYNRGSADPFFKLSDLPQAAKESFREQLVHNRQITMYIRRFLSLTYPYETDIRDLVIIHFSSDATLLTMYGQPQSLQSLRDVGIRESSVWQSPHLGANAVTMGIKEQRSVSTEGQENYNETLKQLALYYCPLILHSHDNVRDLLDFGGVLVLVPVKKKSSHYMMVCAAIAHDLMLNYHLHLTIDDIYNSDERGLLYIDSVLSDEIIIKRTTKALFDNFDLPWEDLRFKPADSLFDPPPANKGFWNLIQKGKAVSGQKQTLSVRGKQYPCEITIIPDMQPRIGIYSLLVLVTNETAVNRSISSKMANSAIKAFDNIIGESAVLKVAIDKCRRISDSNRNLMLVGESGVGKDVFAQAIHNASSRSDKPFISVNCGALPRDLIASELFGYESGAFTGAKKQGNIGKFELANGGTLFLDEIGELPLTLQATLLRVVEEKKLMRLGGTNVIDLDVRIISATNANLPEMIQKKRFRADLYYRLGMVNIKLPPLRERGEDVILLTNYFIRTFAAENHLIQASVSPAAAQLLRNLPWKGNVRELQNLILGILEVYRPDEILPEHIMDSLGALYAAETQQLVPDPAPAFPGLSPQAGARPFAGGYTAYPAYPSPTGYGQAPYPPTGIRHVTLSRDDILQALEICGNNKSAAARYLGISVRTLYRKMEKLGMDIS